MRYTAETLLVRAKNDPHFLNKITAQEADWEYLSMEVRRFSAGQTWNHDTSSNEAALVILGGQCRIKSVHGTWDKVGRRGDVFGGMPYAAYFSRHTRFEVTALSDTLEIAHGWVTTDEDHPARLITPDDSAIEIRGGHNATRQINSIIPPGFDCHRLVVVEVFTPGGNWSGYPPHKHDAHRVDEHGEILEADLEEIYFYKMERPAGFAIQRVYNDSRSIDATMVAQNNDIVLVPEGYHPVSAAYGYNCYYLNFLAGSAQSLANADDPAHAWAKETWTSQDPRLPLVSHAMER